MWAPIFLPSSGVVVTTTEEALFSARAAGSGFRKRAEVISMPLAFCMAVFRYTKRPSLSSGIYLRGRPWIANWLSLGAGRKGSQGELATGKLLLRRAARALKKGE